MDIQKAYDKIYDLGLECEGCQFRSIHFERDEPGIPPRRTRGCLLENKIDKCPALLELTFEEKENEDKTTAGN